MKLLHTADWHLGKRLDKYNRLEEQKAVLEEIIILADSQDVDVVLIAGDLFDAFNPSTEAIELLYKTLKRLAKGGERVVIAIAGNHDSPDRIDSPDALARDCGIIFAGYPHIEVAVGELSGGVLVTRSEPGFIELQLPKYAYPLRVLLTPYANEYRMKTFLGIGQEEDELRKVLQTHWQQLTDKYCDTNGVNILMAHLFVMKKGEVPPEEPIDEKPILHLGGAQAIYTENIPSCLQYVALGHLHRYQEIDKLRASIVYSSSLLSYSFSEAGQQKYVVLADIEPGSPARFERISLSNGRPLHRKRFEEVIDALAWLKANPDTWVELTLVSDNYLTTADRRALHQVHDGIVTIVPEIKNQLEEQHNSKAIDLGQSVDDLFVQYFVHRNGQHPNEELIALFKEIRAEHINE